MAHVYLVLALATASQLSLTTAQEPSDVPDSFKTFENFRFAVPVFSSDKNAAFECMTSKRAWIKPAEKKGEYIWTLQGHHNTPKQTVSIYVYGGSSPDTFRFAVDSRDAPLQDAKVFFTDYEYCTVIDMAYDGHQCVLWSQAATKDSVPQKCVDIFNEKCGEGTQLYSKVLCSEDETADWR
uniref:Putative group ii salivary lipocalin n=1 Tax=Rhipicephalus pulchellus TaxID=72859 RepID=L7LQG1_RHIPC